MRFKTIATLTLGIALNAVAQASVVYEWKDVNYEAPYGITLRLEFDDAAYRAGFFSFHLTPEQPGHPRPDSQLLSLSYGFAGVLNKMNYSPRTEGFANGYGRLDMDITFELGGFLTGTISANNSQHDFSMTSHGRVFTVISAHSDEGMVMAGCVENIWGCSGATGHIQYVPEPGSLALLIAGGVGVIASARRRRMAS